MGQVNDEWSESAKKLAGAWGDFPTLEDIRVNRSQAKKGEVKSSFASTSTP